MSFGNISAESKLARQIRRICLSHIVSGGESLNSGHFEICTIPGSENENWNLNPSTQQEQPNKSLGEYLLTLHESSGAGYPARLTKFSSATLGKNHEQEKEKTQSKASQS
jgi:hypothetical protein